MLTAKFKMKEGTLNIIQVYAPTSAYSESEIDAFYDMLQLHIEKIPKKESVIVMGDLNAKVGADHNAWTPTMGKYGLGSYHPSVQEGRQTRPKQLQSHHPTL